MSTLVSPAQQLFIDFFNEALCFLKYSGPDVAIHFCDFECLKLPNEYESGSYFQPVRPDYHHTELKVLEKWVNAIISEKKPTIMRTFAYYYAYGFQVYHTTGNLIQQWPMNEEAVAFSCGLLLLNGIPSPIPPFISKEHVLRQLSSCTNKQYNIQTAISATGRPAISLTLSQKENNKLWSQIETISKNAYRRKLDVRFGTEEHPFENINEAIEYIEFLEREAVENDEFLNSTYHKDPYRYDLGEFNNNGQHLIGGLYKIPWASAYTAHVDNSFPKNSFIITQLNPANDDWEWLQGKKRIDKYIPLFALKPNLSRRRFLYRGQCEEYKDKTTGMPTCRPNLYRPNVEKDPLPHRIKAYEMACLVTRHPLVSLLGINGVQIFNEPFRFQLNRLGLAQHYYNKTSFLDLTSDINVAKFFATCEYNNDEDSYSSYYSEDKLGVLYIYDMRLPFEFRNHSLPQLSTIGKQYVFLRSAMQSGFLLDMPKDTDLHDLPNVYRVYFRHNKAISDNVFEEARSGERYFPNDALSRHWKTMYKAPNSSFTISVKAREMYLKAHPSEFKTIEELDDALIASEFKIGSNEWPEFPQEILNDYYANSQKLWADFCSDIYFLGSEGFFMKKSLEDLIDCPEYRDSFHKIISRLQSSDI
ncbi:MAG: FRG domain-containing protein [Bacteroidales bacterium]|nr:FRG domain-containing protein [Bacteroidales bacterium]